jgi:hypothetical protein
MATLIHGGRAGLLVLAGALAICLAAPAKAQCVGDCDNSGEVDISDLVLGVNIALGLTSVDMCPSFDCQNDGTVPISCLIRGVNNALNGCPAVSTPTGTPAGTATATVTPITEPPTPTVTPGAECPIAAGVYTTTQVASPSVCTGGPSDGMACTSNTDCPGPQAGYTPFCGGSLKVYSFAPFPFPAGGTIKQDVAAASLPDCVHETVVPFPGGFTAPNFCVPALGYTVSVTQTGCGVGRIDSNGGSDFTVKEVNDTSDSSATCNLPQMGCPPGPPTIGSDASTRVDITVGDGTPDTCTTGSANAIVTVPVHTVTWQDNSPGNFGTCPGDGVFQEGTDSIITQFSQILDFTTDTTKSSWADIDGDGCSIAGQGPLAGQPAIKGTCLDFSTGQVVTVAAGGFGSTGLPDDGSFSNRLANVITGPEPPMGATCDSPPAINFTGTATRCLP